MSSERYPGKVLYNIDGKPMIQYLVESLLQTVSHRQIVLSTSTSPSDDPLIRFCKDFDLSYYRGSLADVAGRILETANAYSMKAFARICGDSPLLDYRLVQKAVNLFQTGTFDLVTNILNRTYPKGQSVEILDTSVFNQTLAKINDTSDKEHVTPFYYRNRNRFIIKSFESDCDYSNLQLSVDTGEDMRRMESLIISLKRPHWEFSVEQLVGLVKKMDGMAG